MHKSLCWWVGPMLLIIGETVFGAVIEHYFDNSGIYTWVDESVVPVKSLLIAIGVIIVIVFTIYKYYKHKQHSEMLTDTFNIFNTHLKQLVETSEYFESAQIYEYNYISNSQEVLQVRFLAGSASEGVEINSIMQGYFYFPYPIFNRVKKFSKTYRAFRDEIDPNKKSALKNLMLQEGVELCNTILNRLNAIESPKEVKSSDCELYRIVTCVISILAKYRDVKMESDADEIVVVSAIRDKDIEKVLVSMKKTGLVGAIILDDLLNFKNQSSKYKEGRTYYAMPDQGVIMKKQTACLVSVNKECQEVVPELDAYCTNQINMLFDTIREEIKTRKKYSNV